MPKWYGLQGLIIIIINKHATATTSGRNLPRHPSVLYRQAKHRPLARMILQVLLPNTQLLLLRTSPSSAYCSSHICRAAPVVHGDVRAALPACERLSARFTVPWPAGTASPHRWRLWG
jgi:hypothetical protein